ANESLRLLRELERTEKDDALRKHVVDARDAVFRVELPRTLFRAMDALIEKRVREAPADDTYEKVRQWLAREAAPLLWEAVSTDLALDKDELEKYWKTREVETPRRATFGSGTPLVVKLKRGARVLQLPEDWWAGAD